ncbi:UNVERIFIED_CONTAM: hypothetical protein Sangu_0225800, partial [Sesamum angustifolium]
YIPSCVRVHACSNKHPMISRTKLSRIDTQEKYPSCRKPDYYHWPTCEKNARQT